LLLKYLINSPVVLCITLGIIKKWVNHLIAGICIVVL